MTSPIQLSRRALLAAGLAAVSRPRRAVAEQDVGDEDKLSQAEAHYQHRPKGEQRCEICLQFLPPNRCRIVQGQIVPQGWCQYFAAKENAR